ncbi:SSI family serine proteinase inhibitor [Kitasatospora sp. NPDC059648]|uniref:SSI family serine proteinase inhibitor n=1 Tax=Kitasatospora sp. NPDC059648 TaxID=3346894 RepID=UPI0036BDADD3
MRRITMKVAGLLATGAASAILMAGTAQAAATNTTLLGSLHLTKTDSTGTTTSADLSCSAVRDGSGLTSITGTGTVTNPNAACTELVGVNGDFSKLLVHPTWMVMALQAPVTATAKGSWGGAGVNWSHTYVNGSELAKYTGDVFGF